MTTPHMELARNISDSTRMACFMIGVLISAKIGPSALFDTNHAPATCPKQTEKVRVGGMTKDRGKQQPTHGKALFEDIQCALGDYNVGTIL